MKMPEIPYSILSSNSVVMTKEAPFFFFKLIYKSFFRGYFHAQMSIKSRP